MKTPSPSGVAASAAAAFSILRDRDPTSVENAFRHLTPAALDYLDEALSKQASFIDTDAPSSNGGTEVAGPVPSSSISASAEAKHSRDAGSDCHHQQVIAEALIRRLVHRCLDKYSHITPPEQFEGALKFHILPDAVQSELALRYGGDPPTTWYDALDQLRKVHSSSSNVALWDLVLDHPMTAYVPVQCQSCGHVVPDDLRSPYSDAELGLTEEDPTEEEAPMVRAGWFRGPRPAKVIVLACPQCGAVSRWFRSRDARTILNPRRWGRLCGEQEDLRLDLANYLGIPVRTCVPLDWDHIWSEEYRITSSRGGTRTESDPFSELCGSSTEGEWVVQDDSARNFAVRLDEGIGSWTGILAISPDSEWCCDVTDHYLQCRKGGGRADDRFRTEMGRYREMVKQARADHAGKVTQAGTLNGYAIRRAHFLCSDIDATMKQAARDYGTRAWYELPSICDAFIETEKNGAV